MEVKNAVVGLVSILDITEERMSLKTVNRNLPKSNAKRKMKNKMERYLRIGGTITKDVTHK